MVQDPHIGAVHMIGEGPLNKTGSCGMRVQSILYDLVIYSSHRCGRDAGSFSCAVLSSTFQFSSHLCFMDPMFFYLLWPTKDAWKQHGYAFVTWSLKCVRFAFGALYHQLPCYIVLVFKPASLSSDGRTLRKYIESSKIRCNQYNYCCNTTKTIVLMWEKTKPIVEENQSPRPMWILLGTTHRVRWPSPGMESTQTW